MSNISIIEGQKISSEELNMYLAEYIHSFQLKTEKIRNPQDQHALLSKKEIYMAFYLSWSIVNHCLFDN